jgi:sugar phosphate isomerase/epimerase
MDRARLALNQYTVRPWTLAQAIEACIRHEIPAIAVWRDKLAELGLARARRSLHDAGLRVSSLCRGGFFPAATERERTERVDDTRRALADAADLGAPALVLVCGPPPPGVSLADARAMVEHGIAALASEAEAFGVRLAIEPLHPMMIAERSVITTLGEANAIADRIGSPAVGVIADVYHIFWDPQVRAELARAGARIAGFHLSDWTTPSGDVTADRAMIGDGIIDIAGLAADVARAGYRGDIEIEILNARAWAAGDLEAWLATALARYAAIDDGALTSRRT